MISKEGKRARVTAIVFGLLAFITLTAFVYAFLQHAEAKRQTQIAIQTEQLCKESNARFEKQLKDLNRQLLLVKEEYRNTITR